MTEQPERQAALPYRLLGPSWRSGQPPVVLVHGASRGTDDLSAAFGPLAEWLGVPLLVPRFAPPAYAGYQRLAGQGGPLFAAHALTSLLHDELGWSEQAVDLVGFSGGAQFVHRFALLFPTRVRRAVVAAAGWYTMLDPGLRFPLGIDARTELGQRQPDVDAFLRLPLRIMVGDRDVHADARLRTGPDVDAQGPNRLLRARSWYRHLDAEATRRGIRRGASFEVLPGTGHGLRQAVAEGGYLRRVAVFLGEGQPRVTADPCRCRCRR